MKYKLYVLPAADADVDSAANHIAENNPDAAMRFLDAMDATYRDLRANPERWPIYQLPHPRLATVRKRALVGFRNYLVFYRVNQRRVEVIRVLHGARDIPSVLLEIE